MPREARLARDGPSRRPPERRWREGSRAQRDPDAGASPLGYLLGRLPEVTRRGAKQEVSTELNNRFGSGFSCTLKTEPIPLCLIS
ncbi:hypothetical protein BZL41_12030 [Pseudomonas sp. PIC25]|nr:hypothetical protein BZL41_12030 [Pseudomonas sp. PIC25]